MNDSRKVRNLLLFQHEIEIELKAMKLKANKVLLRIYINARVSHLYRKDCVGQNNNVTHLLRIVLFSSLKSKKKTHMGKYIKNISSQLVGCFIYP